MPVISNMIPAIKSQALADFVSDYTPGPQPLAHKEVNMLQDDGSNRTWTLNTDGASNVRGIGLGIMFVFPRRR